MLALQQGWSDDRGASAPTPGAHQDDLVMRGPPRWQVDDLVDRDPRPPIAQRMGYMGAGEPSGRPASTPRQRTPAEAAQFAARQAALIPAAVLNQPEPFIKFFEDYPEDLRNLGDEIQERAGATRDRNGNLVNGLQMTRDQVGGLVMNALRASQRGDVRFQGYKKFRNLDLGMPPAAQKQLLDMLRKTGGADGEVAARRLQSLFAQAATRPGPREGER